MSSIKPIKSQKTVIKTIGGQKFILNDGTPIVDSSVGIGDSNVPGIKFKQENRTVLGTAIEDQEVFIPGSSIDSIEVFTLTTPTS